VCARLGTSLGAPASAAYKVGGAKRRYNNNNNNNNNA